MSLQTTFFENLPRQSAAAQAGNATIYVLIVVALFAALAFTITRQNDSSEGSALSAEKADIIAGQIMAYPYQVKQSIDMMTMTGADSSALDFTQPGQPNFDTAPNGNKVYHPGGGGLSLARLPDEGVLQTSTTPPAGWYLGMFNNFEWSQSAAPDVMLVAYQIKKEVCERINLRLTGTTDIPLLGTTIPSLLIDRENPPGVAVHPSANVAEFDLSQCTDCEEKPSACVTDGTRYGFYTMIINR
jgi:hypothetical protein